jgi:hypothetical protein
MTLKVLGKPLNLRSSPLSVCLTRWNNPDKETQIQKYMKASDFLTGLILTALFTPMASYASEQGSLVVDGANHWRHNSKFYEGAYQGAYVVCDGYLGSPLIPNSQSAVEAFIYNCEITPPPGALPIIDAAENHSTRYEGYPAYTAKIPNGGTYFVCDGFLNSTSWCSVEAHIKANELRRAAESRFWEQTSFDPSFTPMRNAQKESEAKDTSEFPIESYNDSGFPIKLEKIGNKNIKKSDVLDKETLESAHRMDSRKVVEIEIPEGYKAVPVNPEEIDLKSLPDNAYIKKIQVDTNQITE